MEPFTRHRGVAVALLRANIDTDAIIPSREIRGVSTRGLGDGLFANWRYANAGARRRNPDFPLNQERFRGASILLGGDNFGCGSSREHAVWALREYGFRVVFAPSFGGIFERNCVRNGVLPARLALEPLRALADATDRDPQRDRLCVDLPAQRVSGPGERSWRFEVLAAHRDALLDGLDPIERSLRHDRRLRRFEREDRRRRGWAYPRR